MRLPVQVIPHRSEKVIEIADVVAQFGDVDGHVVHLAHHVVRHRAHLFHQGDHPVHGVEGGLHVVGLHQHVVHGLFHVRTIHLLKGAAHAELSRTVLNFRGLALRDA